MLFKLRRNTDSPMQAPYTGTKFMLLPYCSIFLLPLTSLYYACMQCSLHDRNLVHTVIDKKPSAKRKLARVTK